MVDGISELSDVDNAIESIGFCPVAVQATIEERNECDMKSDRLGGWRIRTMISY